MDRIPRKSLLWLAWASLAFTVPAGAAGAGGDVQRGSQAARACMA